MEIGFTLWIDRDSHLLSRQTFLNLVMAALDLEKRTRPLFFISAGDPSGDIYGGALVDELRRFRPDASFIGLGGARMREAGVYLLAPPERMAVVGFTEVIRDVPYFHGLLRESEGVFRYLRPDIVILIDYPGFNLRLAERAKRNGRKTLYYVSPQVWAWGGGRCRDLIRNSDEMAVILPFEVEFYKERGKEVRYVGHPIIEEIAAREPADLFMKRYGISPDRPVLCLSPGSRRNEISRHLPLFLEVAGEISRRIPGVQVLVNCAPTISEREMRRLFLADRDDVVVIKDSHHTAIEISRLFLTKSGTSTIEGAILNTPMIVCYRISPLSYLIARSLVRLSHISLVNILAGRGIVPEFIQGDFRVDRIVLAALDLLEDTPYRRGMIRDLGEVSKRLDGGDATRKVADIVLSMLEGRGTT